MRVDGLAALWAAWTVVCWVGWWVDETAGLMESMTGRHWVGQKAGLWVYMMVGRLVDHLGRELEYSSAYVLAGWLVVE